jgi:y4mF family transcriptional regulator
MLVQQFGDAIKARRKSLKITQPHLAELAGVSTNSLWALERGKGNPSLDLLEKLLDVLGLEVGLEIKATVSNR